MKPNTIILHSWADEVVPFADSEELVRNSGLPLESLVEVGREQRLAARSVGMTYAQEMRRIVLPQALRVVIPDIMNQFVVVFKTSTLVSVVAVPDLMYYAHRMVSQLFKPTEIYTSVAVIYILSVSALAMLVKLVERRAKKHLSL